MGDTQVIQSHSENEYVTTSDITVLHVSLIYYVSLIFIGITGRKYPFSCLCLNVYFSR